MPRLVHAVPRYRKHRQSGQAIVTISGRDILLGRYGTKASRTQYAKIIGEWEANDRQPLAPPRNEVTVNDGLTIGELAARYWRFATGYYVKDGRPTGELAGIKSALRPLLKFYEAEPASAFGPVALKAVRNEMVGLKWARSTVNKNIDRIRRMFRWAASEELLPIDTYQRLATLPGLRKGRSQAREAEPVEPVNDRTVDATLPHLPEVVADMVKLQRLTGMRPAEVCALRPCDVDRTADVWTYRPESHKTQHHGKSRVVFIGPQAQAVLLRYLARDSEAYCFRPCDSEAKRRAAAHAARSTPLSCGTKPGDRRARRPKRRPGEHYDTAAYRRAIARACDVAFPAPDDVEVDPVKLAGWQSQQRWAPNQLRHAAATEIRQRFGLEAAQVALGHSRADTTQIYAERDAQKGIEVARMIG